MEHEEFHQFRFLAGKADGIMGGQFLLFRVQTGGAGGKGGGGEVFSSSGEGTDTGQQFSDGKGFGKVIVGTGVQAGNAVIHFGFGGEHDYRRYIAGCADFLQGGDAVFHGHHNVKDHAVIVGAGGQVHSHRPVFCPVHIEALVFHNGYQHVGHIFFVFSKQYTHRFSFIFNVPDG